MAVVNVYGWVDLNLGLKKIKTVVVVLIISSNLYRLKFAAIVYSTPKAFAFLLLL